MTARGRVLVLGADGADPCIVADQIAAGALPNLARLCAEGRWGAIRTTFPPVSPVAWMTCLTGQGPARHGLRDFLVKSADSYLPTIGLYHVRGGADGLPVYTSRRSAATLPELLADAGRTAYLLKVPGTFPPPPVQGGLLAGFGMPDLLGTFGVSAWYTTDAPAARLAAPDGTELIHALAPAGAGVWRASMSGPAGAVRTCLVRRAGDQVVFSIEGQDQRPVAILGPGEWSGWVRLSFPVAARGTVTGLCRFKLISSTPALVIYRTALQCAPEEPLYPLSTPPGFAARLAGMVGPYATLGMPGDMDGVRRGVVDLDTFLEDAYANWAQQVDMALRLLDEPGSDLIFLHLFTVDNAQHLFWAYSDPAHPAHEAARAWRYRGEIARAYRWIDAQLGRLLERIDGRTTVIVVSDHGGAPVYRLVYPNAWLAARGYLAPREEVAAGTAARLDWDRTRAAMYGTGGIWLNVQGREPRGVVAPGAPYEALRREIGDALAAWRDPETGGPVVTRVLRGEEIYGPTARDTGPDLVPALARGYGLGRGEGLGRVMAGKPLIEPNLTPWSGGHEGPYLPDQVPGIAVLWGRGVTAGELPHAARLHDIAPTVLRLLDVDPPAAMEGHDLLAPH